MGDKKISLSCANKVKEAQVLKLTPLSLKRKWLRPKIWTSRINQENNGNGRVLLFFYWNESEGKNTQPDNNFHETKQNLLLTRQDKLSSQREAAIRDKSCFASLETPYLTQELHGSKSSSVSEYILTSLQPPAQISPFTTSSVLLQELITVHEASSSLPLWQISPRPFPGALPWTALEDANIKCHWSTSSAILAPGLLLLLLQ